MAVEVRCHSEISTSRDSAKVEVYEDGKLVATVTAAIAPEKGADGGYYDVVKLTKTP
ncbi:hypothetical protein KW797_03740 [Candidatus Parcubacteria bacterium]|nr:hypothetical protein [Candidatus Parcubacteria bacterium]